MLSQEVCLVLYGCMWVLLVLWVTGLKNKFYKIVRGPSVAVTLMRSAPPTPGIRHPEPKAPGQSGHALRPGNPEYQRSHVTQSARLTRWVSGTGAD